jgi:hypothetical protein
MNLSTYAFSLIMLTACSAGMKIPKSQVLCMDHHFSRSFSNNASKTSANTDLQTLSSIFEIDEKGIESITLTFQDSTSVQLSSNINGLLKSWSFKGRFTQHGYFEVYIRNNIDKGFKSFADIKRIRFTQSVQGNLLVDDFKRNERQFLLWRVGGRYRIQSEFKVK